jgi:hypothetical protein
LAVVTANRVVGRQHELLTMMLTSTDHGRLASAPKNSLLVRECSLDHQQLLEMESHGLVCRAKCYISGLMRFVATRHGCMQFGLTDEQVNEVCRMAVERYGVEWSN